MCKHMNYPFCLNLFFKKGKEDNLRNAIVNHTSISYFNFRYLVQDVIYLFIHALTLC